MSKTRKSYKVGGAANAAVPRNFKDHDIAGTDPNKTQFEPTDANPIRQHVQMAGDPSDSVLSRVREALGGKFKDPIYKKAPERVPVKEAPKEDKTPRRQYLDKAIEG